MKHLLLCGIAALTVFALLFGCRERPARETVYDTTPATKAVVVTVDAADFFEVVDSSVEKTSEGYVGKATLKALQDINADQMRLTYKPTVWTAEGKVELLDKAAMLDGPIKKGETAKAELPFSDEGGEGGRTVNIWFVAAGASP